MKSCYHPEKSIKIVKRYRRNYPFGRKSKPRQYEPPRMCIKICTKCGAEVSRWKPAWSKYG